MIDLAEKASAAAIGLFFCGIIAFTGYLIYLDIKASCLTSGVVVRKAYYPAHTEFQTEVDAQGHTSLESYWVDDSWTVTFMGHCEGSPDTITRTVEVDRAQFAGIQVGETFHVGE